MKSIRLTPTIVEVVVACADGGARVPAGPVLSAAELSKPWRRDRRYALAMEGLALTGASVDREQGLLSTIVLEMGGSSDLCALAEARRARHADGADGHADRNARGRDGAAGRRRTRQRRAVLDRRRRCAPAGSRVIYFAGYKKIIDRYKVAEIERAADVVVWCCDEAPGLHAGAAAGPGVRRQHRRGDRCLWPGELGPSRRSRSPRSTA